MDTMLDLARAKRVHHSTRSLPLAGIPAVDMKDRLSLLTVAAGLRRAGVLETWGQRLPQIRDRVVGAGIATSVATKVWSTIDRPEDTAHCEVLRALDEKRVAGKPRHVLWLYRGPQEREQLRQPNYTQQQAGAILAYPPCCIAFESSVMARLPQAQLDLLIAKIGDHDARLLAAVQAAKELDAPKIPLPDNALRTEQQFPFALHVACNSCLADPGSASGVINARYGQLVREVDAGFHVLFLEVQETYCQITQDQSKNRELLLQVLAAHTKFFEGSL